MASTKWVTLVAMAVALASLGAVCSAQDDVTTIKLALLWSAKGYTTVFGPAPLPTTASTFGLGVVKDYPLYSSVSKEEEIGRARGLYFTHQLDGTSNQEIYTFAFYSGQYAGSSLIVQGNWVQDTAQQELAVTGGTGVFAFARGSIFFTTAAASQYLFDGTARLKDVGSSPSPSLLLA